METGLILAAALFGALGILLERWRVRRAHRRWLRELQTMPADEALRRAVRQHQAFLDRMRK